MSGPIRLGSPVPSLPNVVRFTLRSWPYLLGSVLLFLFTLRALPRTTTPKYNYPPLSRAAAQWYPDPAAPPPYKLAGPFHPPNRAQLRSAVLGAFAGLLAAPIPTHNQSLERQMGLCPYSQYQVDVDHVKKFGKWWAGVEEGVLQGMRETVAERVTAVMGWNLSSTEEDDEGLPQWRRRFGNGGRGIVYTAGNSDTLERLLISLTFIRTHHNCSLPVEIFSFPDELASMPLALRDRIDALGGVTWRAGESMRSGKGGKQFQIKGEAVVKSSFSEVLYLDSDNVPVRNPTFLFRSPVYKERGIVVWPDFARQHPANAVYRTLNRDCDPAAWTAETGQLLVNKLGQGGQNLAALWVAEAMQREQDMWFRMSNGDKDTFRYAFWFLGLEYTPAPHYLSAAGGVTKFKKGHTFCGKVMFQYGLSPDEWDDVETEHGYVPPKDHAPPLFVHANLLKEGESWMNFLGVSVWGWLKRVTGKGYDFHLGNTFTHLKMVRHDRAGLRSRLMEQDLRYKVIGCRGVGTDFWDARDDPGVEGKMPASLRLRVAGVVKGWTGRGREVLGWDEEEEREAREREREEGREEGVEVVEWGGAWGGVLRGFEERFYGVDVGRGT